MNIAPHSTTSLSSMPSSSSVVAKGVADNGGFHQTLDTSMQATRPQPTTEMGKSVSSSVPAGAAEQSRSSKLDKPAKSDNFDKPIKAAHPDSAKQTGNSVADLPSLLAISPLQLVLLAVQPVPVGGAVALPLGASLSGAGTIAPGSTISSTVGLTPSQPVGSAASLVQAEGPAAPAGPLVPGESAATALQTGLANQPAIAPATEAASAPASAPVTQLAATHSSGVQTPAVSLQGAAPATRNLHGDTAALAQPQPTPSQVSPSTHGALVLPSHAPAAPSQPTLHPANLTSSSDGTVKPASASIQPVTNQSAGASSQGQGGTSGGKSSENAAGSSVEKPASQAAAGDSQNNTSIPVFDGAVASTPGMGNPGTATSSIPPVAPGNSGLQQSGVTLPSSSPVQTSVPIVATPPINSARVLASMNGTEMRVGMHSAEFGSISIATTVSASGLAAQIALDHGALGKALAAHLPSIEEKLGNVLGLAAKVEVRNTGALPSNSSGNPETAGRDASSGSSTRQGRAGNDFVPSVPRAAGETYGIATLGATGGAAGSARLSVLA